MSLLYKIKSSFVTKNKILKISFIGLDHAGKSSILKRILEGNFDEFVNKRTVGMEVAKFEISGLQFVAWDIGGQKGFRDTIWQTYLQGSKAIIYVIDSTDIKRLQDSKMELEKYVFSNKKFSTIPILILANKQDLDGSLSCQEIGIALNLHKFRPENIKIYGISCKTGLNIQESITWLCNNLNDSDKKIMYNPLPPLQSIKL